MGKKEEVEIRFTSEDEVKSPVYEGLTTKLTNGEFDCPHCNEKIEFLFISLKDTEAEEVKNYLKINNLDYESFVKNNKEIRKMIRMEMNVKAKEKIKADKVKIDIRPPYVNDLIQVEASKEANKELHKATVEHIRKVLRHD